MKYTWHLLPDKLPQLVVVVDERRRKKMRRRRRERRGGETEEGGRSGLKHVACLQINTTSQLGQHEWVCARPLLAAQLHSRLRIALRAALQPLRVAADAALSPASLLSDFPHRESERGPVPSASASASASTRLSARCYQINGLWQKSPRHHCGRWQLQPLQQPRRRRRDGDICHARSAQRRRSW